MRPEMGEMTQDSSLLEGRTHARASGVGYRSATAWPALTDLGTGPRVSAMATVNAPACIDRLFARIDAQRDDLVALTRELVRIPTINPPGEAYTDCAEAIGRRLAGCGFAV